MKINGSKSPYILSIFLTVGLLVSSASLLAQNAEEDEDVYTLDPFSISEDENVGYEARSSLAGTRLNTPLSDIAATISVVTEEFMDDTGSTDLQELLVYTSNTEILGIGGNFANPNSSIVVGAIQDGQFTRPTQNTRVRGLAAADLTRNYFPSAVAMDSYNTSRVVINRGANAILFGLGSPAGIINNQTISPIFQNHGEVSFMTGSYGTIRSELDVEKVLIENKLSVRVAALHEDTKYQQDPAFERDRRIHGILEWRPWENTTLKMAYESGSIYANRPRSIPPQDMVSRWFDPAQNGGSGAPKPAHDPHNRFQLFIYRDGEDVDYTGGTPSDQVDNLYFGPIGFTFEAAVAYPNTNTAVGGGALPNGTQAFVPIIHPRWGIDQSTVNPDGSGGIRFQSFVTMRGVNQLYANMLGSPVDQNGISKSVARNFYVNEVITDTSLFDYRNLLVDGPNKSEDEQFDVVTGSLEQTFLEGNAGVAYHFNKEEYHSNFRQVIDDGSRFQALAVDVNLTYPNGDANPNFGRLFWSAGGRNGVTRIRDQDLENHRFTGFFKHDLTEKADGFLGELLGDHTFTVLEEHARTNSRNISLSNYDWGEDFRNKGTPPNGANATAVGSLIYASESIANQSSASGANASNMSTVLDIQPEYTMSYFDRETQLHTTGTFSTVANQPTGGVLSKNNIDSTAFILHSKFLNDHIATTYGYREDKVKVWSNGNPPRTGINRRDIGPNSFALASTPNFTSKSDSTSWGLVAHVPDDWMDSFGGVGLSLHYSESDNAQIGQERSDLLGQNLAPVSGETEERGFTISFADERFSIRVNDYRTLQIGEDAGLVSNFNNFMGPYLSSYPPAARQLNIDTNLLQQDDIQDLAGYTALQNAQYVKDTLGVTWDAAGESVIRTTPPGLVFPTDLLSEGLEIEAVANLTPNWRMMFNISQQQVMATNTAPLLNKFISEDVDPTLDRFGHFPTNAGQFETIRSFTERFGLLQSKIKISEDGGIKTNEIREWRWNLITNYAFDSEKLKGWNIGAAARWQDNVGIGRPVINDPELGLIPDLANPIYGPDEFQLDAWIGWETDWGTFFGRDTLLRVQLNIRNVLDDDALIPVVANPDLTIPVYRIPMERRFELRGSLSY
tara:strand:+ start:145 stop:3525 length:3381 start_codon:yes stop_codon:yes gene_type:complete